MKTARHGSGHERANAFIMLLALMLGIALAGCTDKDEGESNDRKNTDTGLVLTDFVVLIYLNIMLLCIQIL